MSYLEYLNLSSVTSVTQNLDRLNNNFNNSFYLISNIASSSSNNCVLYLDNLEEFIGHTTSSYFLMNDIGKIDTISLSKFERFDIYTI